MYISVYSSCHTCTIFKHWWMEGQKWPASLAKHRVLLPFYFCADLRLYWWTSSNQIMGFKHKRSWGRDIWRDTTQRGQESTTSSHNKWEDGASWISRKTRSSTSNQSTGLLLYTMEECNVVGIIVPSWLLWNFSVCFVTFCFTSSTFYHFFNLTYL